MGQSELLLLSVGLSMDAMAISLCKGLSLRSATLRHGIVCGVWFGSFQTLMPLAGYFLGTLFAEAIQAIDHWIAWLLLTAIGINMLLDSRDGAECTDNDFSVRCMFPLAIATSIDALAAGLSLAVAGEGRIIPAVCFIGGMTFLLSVTGVLLGNRAGLRWGKRARLSGGVLLIGLGIMVLLEHLEILL